MFSNSLQWNPTDDAPESIVYQQKIRVAYLQPEGETIHEDVAEQPSMITSDSGDLSVSLNRNILASFVLNFLLSSAEI